MSNVVPIRPNMSKAARYLRELRRLSDAEAEVRLQEILAVESCYATLEVERRCAERVNALLEANRAQTEKTVKAVAETYKRIYGVTNGTV